MRLEPRRSDEYQELLSIEEDVRSSASRLHRQIGRRSDGTIADAEKLAEYSDESGRAASRFRDTRASVK